MTIKEWQQKLDRSVKNLKNFTDPLRIAAFTTTAQMGERIFDEGQRTDGGDIGQYSTKPTYISMSASPKPKGAPTGKPSGKKRKKRITELQSTLDKFGDETKEGPATRRVTIGTEIVAVGGKSKFKNGKLHKSKYFVTGYKGYRENVGRQTAFIDLSLTGELRQDFGNGKSAAQPRKINDLEYQIRLDKEINQDKRSGAEDKYGTIFTLSQAERDLFFNTMQFEFNRRLKI